MQNHDKADDFNTIRSEIIEILNQEEVLFKLHKILKKYNLLANKTISIELSFTDKNSLENQNDAQQSGISSTSLVANTLQFASEFCEYPDCSPPPGQFI